MRKNQQRALKSHQQTYEFISLTSSMELSYLQLPLLVFAHLVPIGLKPIPCFAAMRMGRYVGIGHHQPTSESPEQHPPPFFLDEP